MTIKIIQTITNILDEKRNILKTITSEAYVLHPAEGKALQNIKTGQIYKGSVSLGTKGQAEDYIEIDA